jgi:hypothetical protein
VMNLKYLGGSCRGLIPRYYPGNFLEGMRKTTKNLSQDSRSPGRGLNPGLPEYEAGVLITRPQRSVTFRVTQYGQHGNCITKCTRTIHTVYGTTNQHCMSSRNANLIQTRSRHSFYFQRHKTSSIASMVDILYR